MRFVKLTHIRTEQSGWVNLDLVQRMTRMGPSRATTYSPDLPERTLVVFGPPTDGDPFSNSIEVLETPDEILAAGDPETACPDGGPSRCGYNDYLAAGDGTTSDLSHAAYHAACQQSTAHMTNCTVMERTNRVCETCVRHEQRLRA